ncbi:hypothetical protein [Bradyrhizobium sp. BWA-3-5]|uniref:hypothetical protein n=1 Tax=Bradyrhizobium sp. BWA-3-5 TaxID=3080013 RepID=UPI00293F57D1|nr:hypothetical protein [Bradyrhizobium sp. BWA-3-5]WOH64131.1 hypothetical protein RX331_26515 [Bradyrhizobium sp. BWA-3-5]WOH64248.1 hypothetical protein RX331_27255 [Bradyrhizobium sp. BWA-3-5]WOH70176.1 hypothetical protein RX331_38435 [Bradyrhizobium sp. BWA-3-5]
MAKQRRKIMRALPPTWRVRLYSMKALVPATLDPTMKSPLFLKSVDIRLKSRLFSPNFLIEISQFAAPLIRDAVAQIEANRLFEQRKTLWPSKHSITIQR